MLIFSLETTIEDFEAFIKGVKFTEIKFTDTKIIVIF